MSLKCMLRLFFYCSVACSIILNSCKSVNTKEEKIKQPNIVFILADDLGWSQIGAYGTDYYKTPNIDGLAKEGMLFKNAYAAAAICSPTRASIMTGKYPARLHITDFIAGDNLDKPLVQPDWQKFLPLEEKTFAEILKEAGYKTAIFGKWHLSIEKTPPRSLPYNPDKQGFDETFVTYKPSPGLVQPWQDAENDAHNIDTITNLSIDFLKRNANHPFFLFVSHNAIHDPLMGKQKLIEKYQADSDKKENNPIIASMIEELDNSTGRILETIEQLGIGDHTIVIFFSDNGGKDTYAAQTPLRKGKGWLYEGGIREPLIVRWPNVVRKGTVNDQMVSSIDFFPTFLDMAGVDKQSFHIDGKSLVPTLKDAQQSLSRNTLFWHYPHYHLGSKMVPAGAIRDGNFKLIEWYEPTLLGLEGQIELYDLSNDMVEELDLSKELPEKAAELRKKLDDWRNEVGAQMPTVNQNYTQNN